uniref:NADP-dependent oxidoreductase domain-containing protein n=1 Tax=Schizophyllum commune (strain H4-8 / FGSC 9210) TaxID=578458 RepID=D8Q4K8_SCHCM
MPTPSTKYAQLGKSDLRVSVPIVGTMGYDNPKWASLRDEWTHLTQQAESTFDTANVYLNGDSEGILANIKGSVPNPLGSLETPRWKSLSSYGISKEEQIDGEMITRVEEIAKRRGWAMLQVALAWVLRSVSSPIVGFNSLKRIEQGIVDGELTDEEAACWRGRKT